MTTLATSATAPHEIWSRGDNVLAWQGHPELSADAIVAKIVPHVSSLSERQRDAGAFYITPVPVRPRSFAR